MLAIMQAIEARIDSWPIVLLADRGGIFERMANGEEFEARGGVVCVFECLCVFASVSPVAGG